MPTHTRYRLHGHPVIWPEHKGLAQVLKLKAETMADVWETTYQSNPVAAGGNIFSREWWHDKNRFDASNRLIKNTCVARWHSWDTAQKAEADSAYSALTVGELTPDYRLNIREVWRGRLQFSELVETIRQFARRDYVDSKLRGVIIEDKSSGTSAIQTIRSGSEDWLKPLLVAFQPSGDKPQRARQASVWCANGSVLLPHPSEAAPWLNDFEMDLFSFPSSAFKDTVDSFNQLVLYVENLLAEGFNARSMRSEE